MDENKILEGYLVAALWSSVDGNCNPLDDRFTLEDISQAAIDTAKADINAFVNLAGDIDEEESQIGHDFWLTRNGHGAGFWDGDYPEDTEKVLMSAVETFQPVYIYVGDDDKLYFEQTVTKNSQGKGDQR